LWQKKHLTSKDMIEVYDELISTYPIYSIEDGLSEDDWSGWKAMKAALQTKVQLVADDLVATNIERIAHGIEEDCMTSVIIKPNQIGTITETLQAIKLCKENNLNTIVSHRSGETEDSFIADMAIGSSAGQLKAGGPARSERLAKYNRILLIEDMLIGRM
jgi:enolase